MVVITLVEKYGTEKVSAWIIVDTLFFLKLLISFFES